MKTRRDALVGLAGAGFGAALGAPAALAQQSPRPRPFADNDIVRAGHSFFGAVSRNLAELVQEAASRWGRPNAYILGQEASGALIGGLRYGEGTMYTRNAGDRRIYWQGPSLGFDWGADGDRTMMLVYNLPAVEAIHQRFVGVDGSAYLVGGLGFTALTFADMVVAPIRSGVGARLGVNVGYLKFTGRPTWNPF